MGCVGQFVCDVGCMYQYVQLCCVIGDIGCECDCVVLYGLEQYCECMVDVYVVWQCMVGEQQGVVCEYEFVVYVDCGGGQYVC